MKYAFIVVNFRAVGSLQPFYVHCRANTGASEVLATPQRYGAPLGARAAYREPLGVRCAALQTKFQTVAWQSVWKSKKSVFALCGGTMGMSKTTSNIMGRARLITQLKAPPGGCVTSRRRLGVSRRYHNEAFS